MVNQRIPEIIQPLLLAYPDQIHQAVPGLVAAFYLVGSTALDSFDPRQSDIDFVAVLSRTASQADFDCILQVHKRIERLYPKWKLEGFYFQESDLGRLDDQVQLFLNFHDGVMKWSTTFGLSTVTWWILKNRGIALFGPDPQALPFTVDMEHLLQTQRENLNIYWASWTTRLNRLLALLSDWGVQWAVLGALRQFYTLRTHSIVSKTRAGEYALTCMPERWQPIIREALAVRAGQKSFVYRSRIQRAVDTFRFLRYIIRTCNEL